MKKHFIIPILLLISCLTAACAGSQSAAFVVAGSTSVQPYVEKLAEEYTFKYPEKVIDVQGGGSSAGIQAAESGTADIGMSSRNLRETEQHLWSIEIAKDGLAIIVNPENTVRNLTLEQLRGIYAGDYTNWSQVGGKDARIHITAREEGSGTRSAFEEMVMVDRRITARAIVQDSNGAVRQFVSDDPYSIGFISLGLVNVGERPVKALSIDGVAPTYGNVEEGYYKLFRSFLFVATEKPTGYSMDFIEYIRSPEGQKILKDEGLIPEFRIYSD
ncbi:MAG: phosphate ABC transporter substrate-binding protein [Oscillospiraceae bacterium]|nr:phosphate ABC transporter substrate-binding protein [Oscillospiraceae bacterium]